MYVFSKDKNMILLPINKYIRNSFNLLENKTIFQKYFFEKENINNKFILEFSSNYEDNSIELKFNSLTNYRTPKIIGGFKQYILLINSTDPNDYYFNVVIKPSNEEKSLKEVNIIIKYYNEKKNNNTDYICNKSFNLEKIKSTEKTIDYKLIINNKYENNNYSNNLNYICYLRLIKKKNILKKEKLNTIAPISSNMSYINKFSTIESNKEFSFNLNNLDNNEIYIASFFIKVGNENDEEEKYYSITYEISIESEKSLISIVDISLIIILIIALIIFFIFCCKKRKEKRSLFNKSNIFSFSAEINEDILNEISEDLKNDENKDNYFI